MTAAKRKRRHGDHTADANLVADVRTLYFERGWSVEEVAAELDVTQVAVIAAIRALGEAPLAADPTTHLHVWEPDVDLGVGRYRCACGRTGYRNRKRATVVHRHWLHLFRPRGRVPCGGAVARTPTLDDYDQIDA